MGNILDFAWMLFLLGIALGIGVPILIIKITCDYLAKQIAKENRKLMQEYQTNQMKLNGVLARQIAYELNNYEYPEENNTQAEPGPKE